MKKKNASSEPLNVRTGGRWQKLESLVKKELEVGKKYRIKVKGLCQFAISKEKPSGDAEELEEIIYTKDEENFLWVKTA